MSELLAILGVALVLDFLFSQVIPKRSKTGMRKAQDAIRGLKTGTMTINECRKANGLSPLDDTENRVIYL